MRGCTFFGAASFAYLACEHWPNERCEGFLAEVDSQVWRVYEGETYIGIVTETDATSVDPWPHYTAQSAGDEATTVPTTDDWRAALDHEAADAS